MLKQIVRITMISVTLFSKNEIQFLFWNSQESGSQKYRLEQAHMVGDFPPVLHFNSKHRVKPVISLYNFKFSTAERKLR